MTANPDARSGGLAEVHGFAGGAESHGFVVFAVEDFEMCSGMKAQAFEKFEKLRILFVDGDDFRFVFGTEVGEREGTLLAKFGDSATDRNAVGAGFLVAKAFEQESLNFG